MKRNFTEAFIKKLEAPSEGDRYYVYDTGQPGLCLMVTASRRTFYVYKRIRGGKPVRVKGAVFMPDKQAVDAARTWARAELTKMDKGVDPNEALRARRNQVTLADAWNDYLKNKLEPHARPATIRESRRIFKKHLEDGLGGVALQDIGRSDVGRLHVEIGQANGPIMANRVFELIRRIFNWARQSDVLGCTHIPNPCDAKVQLYDENPGRERVLDKAESKRLSDVLAVEQDQELVDFLTLLAESGQRRSTVAFARWNQIDLTKGQWLIPGSQTKNRRPVTLSLTKPAVEILKRRAAEAVDAEFVFQRRHFQKGWQRVREAAGLKDVWFHDFRRTLGTNLALRGESPPVIGKVLGHADLKSTSIYMKIADVDAAKALQSVSGSVIRGPVKTAKKAEKAG